MNTGSGVPIQSTDEQVCTNDVLSKAVCAGSQVLLPRIKLEAVHAGSQVVLPRIKLPMQVGCGVLDKVTPRLVAMVAVMTRCLVMQDWPHRMVNTVGVRNLVPTDSCCGADKAIEQSDEHSWMPLKGYLDEVA